MPASESGYGVIMNKKKKDTDLEKWHAEYRKKHRLENKDTENKGIKHGKNKKDRTIKEIYSIKRIEMYDNKKF